MSLPDASIPDPATAGEALAASVADANSAATTAAADSLKSAVDALADKIREGTARIDAASASVPKPTAPPVAAAPVFTPETLASMCEQAGLPKEAAGVFVEFAKNVVLPVYSSQITAEARRNKRDAERDSVTGPLMKRYDKEISGIIKERGITDAYLAEHGYEDLARLAASNDPAYFEERVQAEIAKRAPAPAPAAATPAVVTPGAPARHPVEGVAPSAIPPSPRAPRNRDEEIAAVQVTREDVDLHRTVFGMTEKDLKRQRLEIAEHERELGPVGRKQALGIPICRLEDLFGTVVRETA